jgi:hypothetical protein
LSFPFDLFRLDGRVALITGGAGGLGLVFARALAGAGANIALLGRRAEVAQAAADTVAHEFSRRALGVAADVTDQDQVRAAFDHVRADLGRIDILINSAGVNIRKPSVEFSLDDWRKVIDINLTGSFICAQAAAPAMIENGWGREINISSMLGMVGLGERPGYPTADTITALFAWTWVPTVAGIVIALPQLFPDGRLLSPRWRWLAVFGALATTLLSVAFALSPGSDDTTALIAAAFPVFGLAMVASFIPLVLRYRRSRSVERQQLKWVFYGLAVSIPLMLLGTVGALLGTILPMIVILPMRFYIHTDRGLLL